MTSQTLTPWARCATGTVEKINRWSDTKVWTTGGGGYIDPNFGGRIEAPQEHSEIIQHCECSLKMDDGSKNILDLAFTGIPFVEGSRVALVWGSASGGKSGPYHYIENMDINKSWGKEYSLNIHGGFIQWFLLSAIVFAIAYAIMYFIGVSPWAKTAEGDKAYTSATTSAAINRVIAVCPPGQPVSSAALEKKYLYTAVHWHLMHSLSCKSGKAKNNKLGNNCTCGTEADVTKLITPFLADKYQDLTSEQRWGEHPQGFLYAILSLILSMTLGTMWQKTDTDDRKKTELSLRNNFIAAIIKDTKSSGLVFVVDDIKSMMLRRVRK